MCLGHWLNMEGGREKRIKDVCQVSFLDKPVMVLPLRERGKRTSFGTRHETIASMLTRRCLWGTSVVMSYKQLYL